MSSAAMPERGNSEEIYYRGGRRVKTHNDSQRHRAARKWSALSTSCVLGPGFFKCPLKFGLYFDSGNFVLNLAGPAEVYEMPSSFLSRVFGFKSTPKPDSLAFAEKLEWIAASDNPWEVDLLDCRPVTLCWHSATTDHGILDSYTKLRQSDGKQHQWADPLPYPISSSLHLDIPVAAPEGTLFRASQMEEKWDIYHWAGRLFVARSWTGLLHYTARIECDGQRTLVEDIRTLRADTSYGLKELYFLLWSHAQAQLLPAPLPVPDIGAPDSRAEKALAANHLFATFGRFGWFASVASVIDKPILDSRELKTWLEAHPMRKP